MKCVAIDDEPLALDLLEKYISECPAIDLVKTFDDAIEGAAYLKSNTVDLLFVDINMPDLSGLALVAQLDKKPMVIFTTAHKKYAHQGFELEALDYLLKPISKERFEKAIAKALELFQYKRSRQPEVAGSIIVRSEYKMVKVVLDDIEFIESMEDYIKIHLLSIKHPVLTLMSLKGILEILPEYRFSRIHRSYIVPYASVQSIQNRKVKLLTGRELTISDSYLNFIEKWKAR
ncbi:LytR/AlgR family response regulator transcription factor [Dyadobacter bucti]|uniref:LytR/AlgR family response regulator transcription factor n=1 Tax=Dyadobacter bucti TaxID=2572203 RepID=UPI001109F5AC|nr:LytTR family DNA-binding domain-containing protein [Dyadobacter bucti]